MYLKNDNTPAYEPQTIQAFLKTWDLFEHSSLYINNELREIPDTGIITITLADILNQEEVILRFVSGNLEVTKNIRKVFNGPKGQSSLSVKIVDEFGNSVLLLLGNISTTLHAKVYSGSEEITDLLSETGFYVETEIGRLSSFR